MRQLVKVESSTDKKRLTIGDLRSITLFPTSYPEPMTLWAKALGLSDDWTNGLFEELKDATRD